MRQSDLYKSLRQRCPELREQLLAIAQQAINSFPTIPEVASETVTRAVTRAFEEFRQGSLLT